MCTPDSYAGIVRGTHVTYPGYHELAYLHPNRFTPDAGRLAEYGLTRPYAFVRFVSWQASHDAGHTSLDLSAKFELIRRLQERTTVVLSSEGELPPRLESLRLQGPVTGIHDVIAHAELIVGDSGTMVSEAAVLGTPAVLISPMRAGVHDDQVSYGLLARFTPDAFEHAWHAVVEFLEAGPPRGALDRLLGEKIDVTSWMISFCEEHFMDDPVEYEN